MKYKNKKKNGTNLIPRLSIYKSNKFIYIQLINDQKNKTLISHSSFNINSQNTNIKKSKEIGRILAKKAIKKGINKITFNKLKYIYHGKIKALIEEIKKQGLNF